MEFSKKIRKTLKSVFGNETEFSKWLANEGIEYLEEALGVELVKEGIEVKAQDGRLRTDIVLSVPTKDSTDGSFAKVVIENQYGKSDHNHFSKLITYAVVNEAKYAVWIVEEMHPELKQSIDWLNKNTNENINIYVLKAVIETIGDKGDNSFSLIPICEPEEELKIDMSGKKNELSALRLAYLKFWQNFSSYMTENNYSFRARKARPQQWYDISLGKYGFNYSLSLRSFEKECTLGLWISNDKKAFDKLYAQKEEIEKAVGRQLIWDRKDDGVKASSISFVFKTPIDIYNEKKFDEYAKIILDELEEHFSKISFFVRDKNGYLA